MIKIEVKTQETSTFSGTSQRTGKDYSITKQPAWAHLGNDPYPTKIELTIKSDSQPYETGFYKVSPDSIVVNNYNQLAFGELVLIPLASATSKVA